MLLQSVAVARCNRHSLPHVGELPRSLSTDIRTSTSATDHSQGDGGCESGECVLQCTQVGPMAA